MYAYGYNYEYQQTIETVTYKALDTHRRLMVVRCDLRFPHFETEAEFDSRVISRFIESLKAKVLFDVRKKSAAWGRNLNHQLHYVWVREIGEEHGRKHYHVLLFFNKDIYHSLGNLQVNNGNLSAMIKQAWCSATKLTHDDFLPLVHFGRTYYLDSNSADLPRMMEEFLRSADYLAKHVTKNYGDGQRSIGCSL